MLSREELIAKRREIKSQQNLISELKPKQQPPIQNGMARIFSEFFSLIKDRVWTVRLANDVVVKNEVKIPKIEVPKAEVEVKIPDVKVNIPKIEVPKQEIIVKIPHSSIDIKIPDVVVPEIKMPKYPKMPDINIPKIEVPETKVIVEYKEPPQPKEIIYEYDEKNNLKSITEKFDNGEVIATRKYDRWIINDKRNYKN